MEQVPRLVMTVAVIALILGVYQHITTGIQFKQAAKRTEATVISREVRESYCYVRFKYRAEGRDRENSLRLEPAAAERFVAGQKFNICYLPGKPDDVRPDTALDNRSEMYYFGIFSVAFVLYFITRSMAQTYRPNDGF